MQPVEILPIDGSTLVLRARGSELLILPQHIATLKGCKSPKEFTGYFMETALVNRPARKLFEAWLRKDRSLWQRIHKTIKNEMDVSEEDLKQSDAEEPKAVEKAAPKEKEAQAQAEPAAKKKAKAKKASKAKKATTTKPKAKKTTKKTKTAAPAKKAAAKKTAAKKKKAVKKKK